MLPADSDKTDFDEQLLKVRPATRNLIESVMMDSWPRNAAIVDFGLDGQSHYEALYYPIRNGEIVPSVLDAAMGHGEKLSELARGAPSNPHKDIEFYTSWDSLLGREKIESATRHDAEDKPSDCDPRLDASALFAEMTADYAAADARDRRGDRDKFAAAMRNDTDHPLGDADRTSVKTKDEERER